jgi:hypothetical protein
LFDHVKANQPAERTDPLFAAPQLSRLGVSVQVGCRGDQPRGDHVLIPGEQAELHRSFAKGGDLLGGRRFVHPSGHTKKYRPRRYTSNEIA